MKRFIEVTIEDEATADGFDHPVGVVIRIWNKNEAGGDSTKLYTYQQLSDWRTNSSCKREEGIGRQAAQQLLEFMCPELATMR